MLTEDTQRKDHFFSLTPERVLRSVERSGPRCTGRCLALNSMENRVYEVEIEDADDRELTKSVIAKFYRPGRWTLDQIRDEHQFLKDLVERDVPVACSLPIEEDIHVSTEPESGIYFALFPKVRGRAPDELNDEQLAWMGRLLARMHTVGSQRTAPHRIEINPTTYARKNLDFLLTSKSLPMEIETSYAATVEQLCSLIEPMFKGIENQRIHGDCHQGNILWGSEGPFFVDFDDMLNGPCIQDMWLLIPGRDQESMRQLDVLIEGYQQMRRFDRSTIRLIEPLRALRYIHFSAWIARRWDDPIFPRVFSHFGTSAYWTSQLGDLKEQIGLIQSY